MSTAIYGQVVTWNIRNAFVRKATLADNLGRGTGLDVTLPMRGKGEYLKRALMQATVDQLVRKVGEDERQIVFAVVTEHKNLAKASWEAEAKAVVILDKETGSLNTATYTGDPTWIERIQNAIADGEGGLLSFEIGAVLKQICTRHLDAIPLRDTGGAYFVPASHLPLLDRVEVAVMNSLNPGAVCRIQRFGVIAGAREAADIAALHEEVALSEIEQIRQAAAALLPEIIKAKPSTFVKRVKQLNALRKQVALYTQHIGVGAEETLRKIDNTIKLMDRMAELCIKKRAAAKENNKA